MQICLILEKKTLRYLLKEREENPFVRYRWIQIPNPTDSTRSRPICNQIKLTSSSPLPQVPTPDLISPIFTFTSHLSLSLSLSLSDLQKSNAYTNPNLKTLEKPIPRNQKE